MGYGSPLNIGIASGTAFIWHYLLIDGETTWKPNYCSLIRLNKKKNLWLIPSVNQHPVASNNCLLTQYEFSYRCLTECLGRAKFKSCRSSFRSDVWIVMVGSTTSSKADFCLVPQLSDIVSGIMISCFFVVSFAADFWDVTQRLSQKNAIAEKTGFFVSLLYLSVCSRVRRWTYHFYQIFSLILLVDWVISNRIIPYSLVVRQVSVE